VEGSSNNKKLVNAVKNTLHRKLNHKKKGGRIVQELKGTGATLEIKKYFFNLIQDIPFSIYSLTLNKKRVFQHLTENKSRVYNFIARQVIDKIPLNSEMVTQIGFIIDKSKGKKEIKDFNEYIEKQLEGSINPNVPLNIVHKKSHDFEGIQIADLFAYGIFQKYERKNTDWFSVFQSKIKFDDRYL